MAPRTEKNKDETKNNNQVAQMKRSRW